MVGGRVSQIASKEGRGAQLTRKLPAEARAAKTALNKVNFNGQKGWKE
mgnify:CR=1 FL=1